MLIAALLTVASIRKQPKYPQINEWMDKDYVIYMCDISIYMMLF